MFAVIGALMVALPDSVFRRISIYLRVLAVVLLLGLLCSTFAVTPLLRTAPGDPHSLLRWLPPMWFLGLSRTILGRANAMLAQMGIIGVRAIIAVTLLAPMVYVLSYYRYFIRIPETLDTTLRNRAPRVLLPMRLMDRLMLRSGFERGIYRFAMKTLLRNDRHSLILGAFAGLGLVLASQTLVSVFNQKPDHADVLPSADLLSVPFILAYFLICGLRFVFDLPAELNANWVHKVVLDRESAVAAAGIARKIILTFVLPWILVICLPLYWYHWGGVVGGALIAVLLAGCYFLAGLLLRRFSKVPFACAFPVWKQSATVTVLLYVLGLWAFAFLLPALERALLLRSRWYLWILAGMLLAAHGLLHNLSDDGGGNDLVFEEMPDTPFEWLNLSGR
jgi:hypothetical protein